MRGLTGTTIPGADWLIECTRITEFTKRRSVNQDTVIIKVNITWDSAPPSLRASVCPSFRLTSSGQLVTLELVEALEQRKILEGGELISLLIFSSDWLPEDTPWRPQA